MMNEHRFLSKIETRIFFFPRGESRVDIRGMQNKMMLKPCYVLRALHYASLRPPSIALLFSPITHSSPKLHHCSRVRYTTLAIPHAPPIYLFWL